MTNAVARPLILLEAFIPLQCPFELALGGNYTTIGSVKGWGLAAAGTVSLVWGLLLSGVKMCLCHPDELGRLNHGSWKT